MHQVKNNEMSREEQIKAMRQRTFILEREGCCWSDDDRRQLQNLFEQGVGVTEIALTLRRSENAVVQQFRVLNLYKKVRNNKKATTNGDCSGEKCCNKCSHYPKTQK